MDAQQSYIIERWRGPHSERMRDLVAVEDPLEIRVQHAGLGPQPRSISVTMRTPGADVDLALGYLYCEGVIRDRGDVAAITPCGSDLRALRVNLTGPVPDLAHLQRAGALSSSCGVCGKTRLEAITAVEPAQPLAGAGQVSHAVLLTLPQRLRTAQTLFSTTGGLHGVGLFDLSGRLLAVREDVGRHNALDKLIGQGLMAGGLPWTDRMVLLSGRASFELLQKARMAGASIVAAVGAPSSLAVDQAQAAGITLLGFLHERGFNVYTHPHRVIGFDADE